MVDGNAFPNMVLPIVFLVQIRIHADGVNYRIEQPEGFCLITAWIGDEKPEIPETSFF